MSFFVSDSLKDNIDEKYFTEQISDSDYFKFYAKESIVMAKDFFEKYDKESNNISFEVSNDEALTLISFDRLQLAFDYENKKMSLDLSISKIKRVNQNNYICKFKILRNE